MAERVVALTRPFFAEDGPEASALRVAGATVRIGPDVGRSDEAALIERCQGAWAVLGLGPFTPKVLSALPTLRFIQGMIIGYDWVNVEAATERGIAIANNPAFCREEVSDHAAMLILAAARRLPRVEHQFAVGGWDMLAGIRAMGVTPRVAGSTLGFIGFGAIARLTAEKLRAFSMRTLAHDPYQSAETAARLGVQLVSLDELCAESDIISMHALLSDETRGMVTGRHFARMKPTAWLVNTSRGATIDEVALIAALREGRIGGACLDVVETEPATADNPLLQMPNVLLTPHVANYSEAARADQVAQAVDQVVQVLGGAWPNSLVNPEVKAMGGIW